MANSAALARFIAASGVSGGPPVSVLISGVDRRVHRHRHDQLALGVRELCMCRQGGEDLPGEAFLLRHLGRGGGDRDRDGDIRSEEHTSELQSLMRISYA